MKILQPLAITSMLFLAACTSTPQDKAAVQSNVHNYQCESGAMVVVVYPTTDSAMVQYQGTDYKMQIAVSASGARYVGGGYEWWTKGSKYGAEGTLFKSNADGTTGATTESCTKS